MVREVFDAIDEVHRERSGRSVSSVVFDADALTLERMLARHPDELQLAVYGASVAAHRTLVAAGAGPDLLVGHSLGEIAALVSAGAFSIADGASIVSDRNAALRAHAPESGMLILRCGRERAVRLVEFAEVGELVLAADNAPAQTVLSGPPAHLEAARVAAEAFGVAAVLVAALYGFHNPGLLAVGKELARRAARYPVHPLAVPVYSPILGRHYRDGDDLAGLLGAHLTQPVDFRTAVASLYGDGARVFVELGVGGALTGLVRKAFPLVAGVRTLADGDDARSLATAAAYIRGKTVAAPLVPAPRPAEVPVNTPPAPAPVVTPAPMVADRGDILSQLRRLYAEALEYPVEVLAEDALLEADLGVDSMRQTELMTRARKLFDLPAPAPGFRSTDLDTLGKVADYVVGAGELAGSAGSRP